MAKSKPTKSFKKAAAPPAPKAAAPKGKKEPVAKKAAASKPAAPQKSDGFSPIEIGHAAGDVWGLLVRDGAVTIAALKKEVDAPGDVVIAAIGWLAREDKLEFSTQGRTVKISLRS